MRPTVGENVGGGIRRGSGSDGEGGEGEGGGEGGADAVNERVKAGVEFGKGFLLRCAGWAARGRIRR